VSLPSSPEPAVASWEGHCLDGAPSALLNLMPTAEAYCSHDRQTGACLGFRYGMTSRPLTGDHGGTQLTLSLVDFPAKTSALRVAVEDLPPAVRAFGSQCSGLLARFGLALSSRKTVRTYVPVASAPSSMDLPAWGMTLGGACWELGTSVRHIVERGYGFELPTPTTQGNELAPSMTKWPSHRRLWDWLAEHGFVPTPTASLYGSSNNGNPGDHRTEYATKGKPSLEGITGGVVPPLREWIMGWPIGWTALEPLATDKYQQWQRLHGKH